jgi:hypothetical protein
MNAYLACAAALTLCVACPSFSARLSSSVSFSSSVSTDLLLDAFVDLFSVDRDVLWRIYANAYLVTLDAQHGNRNFIADHKGFADAAGKNEHVSDYP